MFTGIVEELGRLTDRRARGGGVERLVFAAPTVAAGTRLGDSIAVNGCCLTVAELGPGWWAADAVAETLGRTNLGGMGAGAWVNLERAARLGDRMGGHLVQGHVDGTGVVTRAAPDLEVRATPEMVRYLVVKGSVTVDGCSLTVVGIGSDSFSVAVIPHTAEVTTIGLRACGDDVNLEVDLIAKYVERLLAGHPAAGLAPGGEA
ncbi:MAG: riboflavin synthase [Acidimicrobiales bacterium]